MLWSFDSYLGFYLGVYPDFDVDSLAGYPPPSLSEQLTSLSGFLILSVRALLTFAVLLAPGDRHHLGEIRP